MFRLHRLWSPGGGTQIVFMPFNKAARVVAITVGVTVNGGETGLIPRWSVLSQDALVSVPLAFGQARPTASLVLPPTIYFCWLVNQQAEVPVDGSGLDEFGPALLPPDLWLNPGERVQLDLTGGITSVFTDAFLSVLLPWSEPMGTALEAAQRK